MFVMYGSEKKPLVRVLPSEMDKYINLRLSKVFRLLPPQKQHRSYHTFHGMLVITILFLLYTINLFLRIRTYYHRLKNLEKLLDTVIHTFTTLTNINSIVGATFFLKKHWVVLLGEYKTPLLVKGCASNTYFYILTLLHGVLIYIEINYYLRWSSWIVIFLIPSYINIFIILVSVLNINYYGNELKSMLCTFRLNLKKEKTNLEEISEKETNPYMISRIFAQQSKSDEHFRYFIDICYRLNAFNKIYGWQILNFAAIVLIFAYESLNIALKEASKQQTTARLEFFLLKMSKSLNFLVYAIMLIHPCFKFNCEMEKVVVLCRKILINLPETSDKGSSRYMRLKLIFLLKQIEMRKPYFSAAGFFEVDYVMLVYILNGITSYLMVTLQAAY